MLTYTVESLFSFDWPQNNKNYNNNEGKELDQENKN